jgi:uncharacterized protein YceH (UPF0502 family)
MKKAEKNLEAFKKGVISALKKAGKETDEYTSLFWGNVDGNEFENEADAEAHGEDAAQNELDKERN